MGLAGIDNIAPRTSLRAKRSNSSVPAPKPGLLRFTRNDAREPPTDLSWLRRIFLEEALEILLHRIGQRDRVAHVVDRAVEGEAHHARKLGLAVRLLQQQHALARTYAGIEGAERVARGVEHPERPAQFGDLQCKLPAVHGAGHD